MLVIDHVQFALSLFPAPRLTRMYILSSHTKMTQALKCKFPDILRNIMLLCNINSNTLVIWASLLRLLQE